MAEIHADGMEVGEARCYAAAESLKLGHKYLLFLDWDVLVPPAAFDRLVHRAENHPEIDVISGVYCVKQNPPSPLIFKGWGCGPYWDWTPGDFLTEGITGCGMGCTLIRTSVFEKLTNTPEKPWFKTVKEVQEFQGQQTPVYITEDFWFLKRAVEEAGSTIAIDTGILCAHIDPASGIQYVLPEDSLPARRMKEKFSSAT